MKIIGNSDVGSVRQQNQDAYLIYQPEPDVGLAVVCDGMGGARGGLQASSLAIQTVRAYFEVHSLAEDQKKAFSEIVQLANRNVYNEAYENAELSGMGTTLVAAWVHKDQVCFANVGDSRGYHITNGNIRQITKDHSAVQELVDSGHLTERQAKIHPNKNIITRAIGVEDEVEHDFFSLTALPGDIIILCSDGLTNHVDENEIHFEVSGGNFEDLPKRLIDLANSRGGTDNITVVAIQI
ncbi:MAG: Stp1/IreP family PP2C-type Ser/Thr phosphatase [Clostridia bacterium]|nr:Stp1/IreP family PP2C-type Ser/Thr phosphatase [Clostridia bacterium]